MSYKDSLICGESLFCSQIYYFVFCMEYEMGVDSERWKPISRRTVQYYLLLACEYLDYKGIRYYMNSKEFGEHHTAHVHVDVRHEASGTFSIIDGTQLSEGKIKKRDVNKIQDMIEAKKETLINYWNQHTDGMTDDLNQALGIIPY